MNEIFFEKIFIFHALNGNYANYENLKSKNEKKNKIHP